MTDVLSPLKIINDLVRGNPEPYLRGKCFAVFEELRKHFPQARALYNGDHVVTLIDGHIYDASGLLYYPFGNEPRAVSQVRRSSQQPTEERKQMKEFWLVTDGPMCDESKQRADGKWLTLECSSSTYETADKETVNTVFQIMFDAAKSEKAKGDGRALRMVQRYEEIVRSELMQRRDVS